MVSASVRINLSSHRTFRHTAAPTAFGGLANYKVLRRMLIVGDPLPLLLVESERD